MMLRLSIYAALVAAASLLSSISAHAQVNAAHARAWDRYEGRAAPRVQRHGRQTRHARKHGARRGRTVQARLSPPIARTAIARAVNTISHVAGGGSALVNAMAGDLGRNLRHVYRVAYCGLYLGTIVRRLGYTPPAGHALARNWRHFGVAASGPAPGVIMVMNGHVGVVKQVLGNGRVVLRGGNQGRGLVRDITVSTRRAIAWRRPA